MSVLKIIITKELVKFKEHNLSLECNSTSACQKISPFSWSPKVNYHIHKIPSLVPKLRQMNPVHNLPFCSFKIWFNLIPPSTPRSYKWSLPFRFSDQKFSSISNHPSNILWSVQVMQLFNKHFSSVPRHFLYIRPKHKE